MSDANRKDPLFQTAKRLTRRAWAQLYWEQYAPLLAVAVLALGLFLIASFGGIWDRLGDPWRLIGLIATGVLLVKGIRRTLQRRRPTRSRARRRVETDSDAAHRPLDVLYDRPAPIETSGHSLWSTYYTQTLETVARLKPSKLRPALAPIDRYYLRAIIPCALGLALMVGFGDNTERLRRALTPTWQSAMNANDLQFDAWIDPPDYTGRPPVYFRGKDTLTVPKGSELVARISGLKSAPRLKLSSQRGARYLGLKQLDTRTYEARTVLSDSVKAEWRIGATRNRWNLTVIDDERPRIVFDETPKADKRDRLVFSLSLDDDYGVETLDLEMRLITDNPEISETEIISVPLPSASVKRLAQYEQKLDLTAHKWAGEKVSAVLIARDGLGQSAETDSVFFTVPDKIFVEPLAKAVMEHRQLLLTGTQDYKPVQPLTRRDIANRPFIDPDDARNRLDRAPKNVKRALLLIDAVTDSPSGVFQDPTVYMGLRHAAGRIRYAHSQEDLEGLTEDLWSIALRAEFGVLGTALEAMRRAEQSLRDGLARRAPQREVDTLFRRYDETVDNYIEELRRQALEAGDFAEGSSGNGSDGLESVDEIQQLLEAIEEANRVGDVIGARKALARLAELLERMKIQIAQGGGGEGGDAQPGEISEEMREALEEMADLLGDQRELKDETEQAEQQDSRENSGDDQNAETLNPDDNQAGGGSETGPRILTPSELAAQQRLLEQALEDLAENLPKATGGSPDPSSDPSSNDGARADAQSDTAEQALEDAANAMANSQQALSNETLAEAREAQSEAIAALRRAGRALADQARAQRQERSGEDSAESTGQTDPLGRSTRGGNDDESETDIEQKDNATRSREILKELRRRASEQEREQNEREYLERLLERF